MAGESSSGNYTKPGLRERIKSQVMAGSDGGKPGQWSARKAQLVAQKYKERGGGYKGGKSEAQKSLSKWTKQEWTTSDGKPAERPGGTTRYLPKDSWKKLSPGERAATNAKKREGSREGRQFVANTEAAAEARKEAAMFELRGRAMDEVQIKLAAEQHTLAVFGLQKVALSQTIGKFLAGKNVGQMMGRTQGLLGGFGGAALGGVTGAVGGAVGAPEGQGFSGALKGGLAGAGIGAIGGGLAGRYGGRQAARSQMASGATRGRFLEQGNALRSQLQGGNLGALFGG